MKKNPKKAKTEVERRFTPTYQDLPEEIRKGIEENLYPKSGIIQGYLGDANKTRLRCELAGLCESINLISFIFYRTWKTGQGIARFEDEKKITRGYFIRKWKEISCHLFKVRYFIPWNGITIEYNVFVDELTSGYLQIEVEFSSKRRAKAFIPPTWFGPEVTDDSRHDSFNLAMYGNPKED